MPCLTVLTNVPSKEIPEDFVDKIIPLLSKTVQKPEPQFTCVIVGDCKMSFGGDSAARGVVAKLESIGHLNAIQNRIIAKGLTEYMEKELDVKPDRFFLSLYDVPIDNIARFGDTASNLNV